jgi:hypothetical protein
MAESPAARPDSLNPVIKMIACSDQGIESTRFYGPESFVKAMGRPGRLVTSFTTDRGKYKFTHGGGKWF